MFEHSIEYSDRFIGSQFGPSHEIRTSVGRFSAEEIRQLMGPDAVDVRELGCPEEVFLRVLESRAALREVAEIRQRAAKWGRRIAADDARCC
jgi:hypothetical protein